MTTLEAAAAVELRAIKGHDVLVGYYDDPALLEQHATRLSEAQYQIYSPINPISPEVVQNLNEPPQRGSALRESGVSRRLVLPYDIDADRPIGHSATEAERRIAYGVMQKIGLYWKSEGVGAKCLDSGNGYQLFLPIDLPNTPESKALIEAVLDVHKEEFDVPGAHLDKWADANRILRIPGYMNWKGDGSIERPYRKVKLLREASGVATKEMLEKVAARRKSAIIRPVVVEDATSRFTYENTEEMLAALAARNESFRFEPGQTSVGQGWKVTCWNREQHTQGVDLDGSSVVWVNTRGFADFCCSHGHCREHKPEWTKFIEGWGIQDLQKAITTPSPMFDTKKTEEFLRSVDELGPAEVQFKLPVPVPDRLFRQTDTGNAERFSAYFSNCFRHTSERGWFSWDGRRWQPQSFAPVMRAAILTARSIQAEAATIVVEEGDEGAEAMRESYEKWARASESKQRLDAMIGIAKSASDISAELADFDRDDWIFNCANGSINLKTFELYPHTRGHMLSAISPVPYVEGAQCPRFLAFMDWAMKGDKEMIAFLRRAAGYALTGSTNEQCFFLNTGKGRNGKSTWVELIGKILGDYSTPTAFSTFIQKKSDGGIPNDLAALRYARMVVAAEAEKTQKLAESLIKSLTGGERISARFLHGEYFSYFPKFKIFMSTNFRPQISGVDDGIWRRVKLIPWENQIPEAEVDAKLPEKLFEEAPGVLQWMLAGLKEYHQIRLATPEKVDLASKKYRKEEDSVGRFIADLCEEGGEAPAEQLYQNYKSWCEQVKDRAMPLKHFRPDIEGRGYERKHTKKGTVYQGIHLGGQTRVV